MESDFHYLVVEDDDDHAALLERNFRSEIPNAFVERVADGVEALTYLRREPPYEDRKRPDVILLDLKLPRVTGLELLQTIKQDESLRTIPVIVLTTSAAESDRLAAYALHVNSYLVKPMDFSGFRDLVRDLCHYWGTRNCPVPNP